MAFRGWEFQLLGPYYTRFEWCYTHCMRGLLSIVFLFSAVTAQSMRNMPRMKRLSLQLTSSAFTTIQHDLDPDYDPCLGQAYILKQSQVRTGQGQDQRSKGSVQATAHSTISEDPKGMYCRLRHSVAHPDPSGDRLSALTCAL